MQKLLKLVVLTMIVLSNYSTSWSKNNTDARIPFTGERADSVSKDSVLIAYDDLRKVNVKLTELKYCKLTNSKLNDIIKNDSIIINNYKVISKQKDADVKRVKRQRNIAIGGGILSIGLLILSLFK